MASKLDIWNRGLRKIGEARLSGLDEDSVNGRMLRDGYEESKRAVLEMHSWKFARKQANLPLNATTPLEGYANSFKLPSDLLKIIYFNNTYPNDRQRIPFTTVGRDIHTDEGVVKITYLSHDVEEGDFSAGFTECLSTYIAFTHSFERTKSQPLMDRLNQQFERQLSSAKRSDAAMDCTPGASMLSYPNIAARFTSSRYPNGRVY